MGVTKYPVLDKDFLIKCLGVCRDDKERGVITILDLTGMHVSSLCSLDESSILRQGKKIYIQWKRPKTNKTLQVLIQRKEDLPLIEAFLKSTRKRRQHYYDLVREIGEKAGYQGISPMTFRHNFCIKSLEQGYNIWQVPHRMGCTLDVAARNYTKMTEDQLDRQVSQDEVMRRIEENTDHMMENRRRAIQEAKG